MYRILRADLINLASRCFFSPLDADPSRRLPRGPAPSCEEPWAAARARRPSPAPCDMRSSLTGAETRASRDVAGGGRATVARPDLRGTARGLRRRAARPCGGAQPGPTPHGKAQSEASASRRMRLSVTSPPGRRGAQPPPQPGGHDGNLTNRANPHGQPPPPAGGGLRQDPQVSVGGPDRTERRSRSVHKSAKTASRRWFGAFVYTVASELRWVTRVSQPPWDACGTDGVLLQQGTHSTRREDQMCVACVYPAHFYLLALDARRGRCRCDVSESLTSQS